MSELAGRKQAASRTRRMEVDLHLDYIYSITGKNAQIFNYDVLEFKDLP